MPISTIGQNGLNAPLSLTSPTVATPTFTGQATIPTINLTGGQITFPATQSASSDANTLDDYEEGTWTPSIGGTATYDSARYGRYVKVGRIVHIQFFLGIVSVGTGGSVVSGLPFTSENIGRVQTGSISYFGNVVGSNVYWVGFYVENNLTSFQFVTTTGATSTVNNGPNIFTNNTVIYGSASYTANA